MLNLQGMTIGQTIIVSSPINIGDSKLKVGDKVHLDNVSIEGIVKAYGTEKPKTLIIKNAKVMGHYAGKEYISTNSVTLELKFLDN